MPASQLIVLVVVALFAGLLGYSTGKSRAWAEGIRECFDPFFAEGYYNGWLPRHRGAPLEDLRVHPHQVKRPVPTLVDPDREISHWMQYGDHLPFEEYRAEQVAELNRELERDKQSKNQKSDA
jgi:hypothetical protein